MIYRLNVSAISKLTSVGRVKYKQGWKRTRSLTTTDSIFFVISGEFSFVTPDGIVTISSGNLQFLPAGTPYTVHVTEECDYFYMHFVNDKDKCTVNPEEYREFIASRAHGVGAKGKREKTFIYLEDRYDLSEQKDVLGRMVHMFTKCEGLMTGEELYSSINAGSAAVQTLAVLGEMTFRRYTPDEHRPVALIKMLEYIRTNYTKPITLAALAENCGISKQYAMRLFKKHYNTTVTQYINRFKLDKAKRMLKYTTLNIDEISFSLGYSATYYFCRLFKRYFGCTPTEYRNNEVGV